MEKKDLVRKIGKIPWTSILDKPINPIENDLMKTQLLIQTFESCQKLEGEGFGMLENPTNRGEIDNSCSVVCPDGSIFTPEQITNYLIERKGSYSSRNPNDVKMNEIYRYYLGFKEIFPKRL